MNNKEYPLVDTHSHILPQMDDGAKNVQISIDMVNCLLEQGVQRVFATPHFYYHRESVSEFIIRRENAYMQFLSEWSKQSDVHSPVLLGAEISIERDLVKVEDLNRLCIAGTDILLLEMPFNKLKHWEISVLENISYKYRVRPMIADLDRYFDIYDDSDFKELLSIPDVIVQVNSSFIERRAVRAFFLKLINKGVTVVLGSDSHDMKDRKPEYFNAVMYLKKKLSPKSFESFMLQMNQVLYLEKK